MRDPINSVERDELPALAKLFTQAVENYDHLGAAQIGQQHHAPKRLAARPCPL